MLLDARCDLLLLLKCLAPLNDFRVHLFILAFSFLYPLLELLDLFSHQLVVPLLDDARCICA